MLRKLIVSANGQQDSGRKHVEFPWPASASEPVSEFRTRGFSCVAFPLLFPGGVGFFFDDRPYGEELKFPDWLEHLVYYYDGRFAADVAFPFVALNMMYRRRSAEQSGRFLKNQVDEPPLDASDIHDRIRSGDGSFLDRLRQFGGGVLRGADSYWSGRSGDVAAWLQYQVGDGVAPHISLSRGVSPSSIGMGPWIGWMAQSPRRLAMSWTSGGAPRAASRPYRITRWRYSSCPMSDSSFT